MSFRNQFEQARDFLILHRADYGYAQSHFKWPQLEYFNWALDYFDPMAAQNDHIALWIVDEKGRDQKYSFEQMSHRSNQAANFLRRHGLRKGDLVLFLVENDVALWELMLACMKVGVVMVPMHPLLSQQEIQDTLSRETIKAIVTLPKFADRFTVVGDGLTAILVDEAGGPGAIPGWIEYSESKNESHLFEASDSEKTKATDPLLRYYVAANSVKSKMVEHSHFSFPVGRLSTMYWMGLHPGDIHLGINANGSSMHDWNCFIAPWNAEATILVRQQERFSARSILQTLVQYKVTTFCAPPTVWRLLQKENFGYYKVSLREALSTGGPLSDDLIADIYKAWGLFIRDGYGQAEMPVVIGVPPEEKGSFGTMGRALPGFQLFLRNEKGEQAGEGEICIQLKDQPAGLLSAIRSGGDYYQTGDHAYMDYSGNFVFEMRSGGVFRSSDYRISSLELESVLKEYPAVSECAVIPSADPLKGFVPKALITLAKGIEPTRELALDIMNFSKTRAAPYKRIRRIEFSELPKDSFGVIPRDELINNERLQRAKGERATYEFWEEDAKIILRETWAQELP